MKQSYVFSTYFKDIDKGILSKVAEKIDKLMGFNIEYDKALILKSVPIEQNPFNNIFVKGEIYSGKDIIIKTGSVKDFNCSLSIEELQKHIDENRMYRAVKETLDVSDFLEK